MKRAWIVLAVLAALGIAVVIGRRGSEHAGVSILLITVDTLRPDRLSSYGYAKQQTPGIDSLAQNGALFESAMCDIPWTTGSMASVMTGTFSSRHGVHLPNERLAASQVTLAELFKAQGYRTAAVVGSFPVSSVYGLNQGFDTYDEDFSEPYFQSIDATPPPIRKIPNPRNPDDFGESVKWADDKMRNDSVRPDAAVTDRAIAWLEGNRGRSFFLWVHYFGPHERLFLMNSASSQHARMIAEYDGDLQKTDEAVARLLQALERLGLTQRLAVVLHSDHGQSLGEHGFVGHGNDLYDVSTHVPLLVRLPGHVVAGTRISALVRNVDISPTVLELAGVPAPPDLDGRSLVPLLHGATLPPLPAYSETFTPTVVLSPFPVGHGRVLLGPMSRAAVRTQGWKFIVSQGGAPCSIGTKAYRDPNFDTLDIWRLRDPQEISADQCAALRGEELYDLTADPGELSNATPQHPDVQQEMRTRLTAIRERRGQGERIELSPTDKERLRSLGYQPGND